MNKSNNIMADQDANTEEYFADKKYMALLPLLEKPLSEIRQSYQNLDNEKLIELVNFALDWETKDYWQSLSVEWLESGLPIKAKTKEKLEKIFSHKKYSQRLRHKVQKLLKQNKS
jgi:hypothetical protein